MYRTTDAPPFSASLCHHLFAPCDSGHIPFGRLGELKLRSVLASACCFPLVEGSGEGFRLLKGQARAVPGFSFRSWLIFGVG